MKIIHRIFQYIDYKGLKPEQAEAQWGLSNGYLATTLKRNGDVGESKVVGILGNSLDLSRDWLVFGEGEMIQSGEYIVDNGDMQPLTANEPSGSYTPSSSTSVMSEKEIIKMLRSTIELQEFKISALSKELDQIKRKDVLQKNI